MRKKGGRVQDPEGDSFGKGGDGENPRPEIRERFGAAGGLGRIEKMKRQEKADPTYRDKDNY
jgi:hypothetical protein